MTIVGLDQDMFLARVQFARSFEKGTTTPDAPPAARDGRGARAGG
jgi:hypothetical protein